MFLRNLKCRKVKSIFFIFFILSNIANSVELRVGLGKYDWDMGISGLMDASAKMNSKIVSLVEPHSNFADNFYYEYSGDFYWNKFSSNISTSIRFEDKVDVPGLGSVNTVFVENKDYKTSKKKNFAATDLNFGFGYDIYHENENYFGIGINTGYVSPTMNLTNKKIKKKILKKLETEISLYKFGVSIQSNIKLSPNVSLKGNAGFGLSKGRMKNKWLNVEKKVDGNYKIFNLSLNYRPDNSNYYLVFGAIHKSWNVDKIKVNISRVIVKKSLDKTYGMYELDFMTNYIYLGIGYEF